MRCPNWTAKIKGGTYNEQEMVESRGHPRNQDGRADGCGDDRHQRRDVGGKLGNGRKRVAARGHLVDADQHRRTAGSGYGVTVQIGHIPIGPSPTWEEAY